MKTCSKCKQDQPVDAFHGNRRAKDGLQSYCKPCANVVRQEYEARNAESLAQRRAERIGRAASVGSKSCTKCGEQKPMLAFYVHRSTKDGRATYCIYCVKADRRAWVAANRDKVRAQNERWASENPGRKKRDHRQYWLKMYGLTQDAYAALLDAQGNVCVICQKPERAVDVRTGEPRRLSVDHCHTTGRVRGLLCGHCNRGVGQFSDDPAILARAAEYLAAQK